MKNRNFILIGLMSLSLNMLAQENSLLNLQSLEIPNSPAFSLLDKAPTSIESPTSSKAFIISALNTLNENNSIPKNYAVEFTPFWFFKNPNMSADKYFGYNPNTQKQNYWKDLLRASVSIAFISEEDSINNGTVSNIALGGRTKIFSVRNKKDFSDYQQTSSSIANFLKSREQRMGNAIPDSLLFSGVEADRAEYDRLVAEFLEKDSKNPEIVKLQSELNEILNRRPVFAIDAAVGYNRFFLNNTYSENYFGRFGAWLTANYSQVLNPQPENNMYLNIYGIARYLSDGTTFENNQYIRKNFFDAGGKLEYEYNKFSAAIEYLYRFNDTEKNSRYVAILQYHLLEQVALTCSFGKNFGDSNNLVAFLGLNWGLSFGKEKVKVENK
jgi:hypothetical protein